MGGGRRNAAGMGGSGCMSVVDIDSSESMETKAAGALRGGGCNARGGGQCGLQRKAEAAQAPPPRYTRCTAHPAPDALGYPSAPSSLLGSPPPPAAPRVCRLPPPPPVYKLITRKAEVGPARAGCQPAEPSRRGRLHRSQRGPRAPAPAAGLFTVGSAAGAAARAVIDSPARGAAPRRPAPPPPRRPAEPAPGRAGKAIKKEDF